MATQKKQANELSPGQVWAVNIAALFLFPAIVALSYNDEGLGFSEFTGTQDINYFAALGAILIFRTFAFQWGQQVARGSVDGVSG